MTEALLLEDSLNLGSMVDTFAGYIDAHETDEVPLLANITGGKS